MEEKPAIANISGTMLPKHTVVFFEICVFMGELALLLGQAGCLRELGTPNSHVVLDFFFLRACMYTLCVPLKKKPNF